MDGLVTPRCSCLWDGGSHSALHSANVTLRALRLAVPLGAARAPNITDDGAVERGHFGLVLERSNAVLLGIVGVVCADAVAAAAITEAVGAALAMVTPA